MVLKKNPKHKNNKDRKSKLFDFLIKCLFQKSQGKTHKLTVPCNECYKNVFRT